MQDVAEAEAVFREERRVQRDFVPVREGIAYLGAQADILPDAAERLDLVLDRDTEPVWQADLYFLGEEMIRTLEA